MCALIHGGSVLNQIVDEQTNKFIECTAYIYLDNDLPLCIWYLSSIIVHIQSYVDATAVYRFKDTNK